MGMFDYFEYFDFFEYFLCGCDVDGCMGGCLRCPFSFLSSLFFFLRMKRLYFFMA